MAYTEAELLRIRMDCLFTYEAGRMLYVNEPWRQTVPAPLLHAGRTLEGEICYRFGQQVSPGAMSGAQAMLESGVWDADAYGKVQMCIRDSANPGLCGAYQCVGSGAASSAV